MDKSIKKDIRNCFFIGLIAGLFSLFIVNNIVFKISFLKGVIIVVVFLFLTVIGYTLAYFLRPRIPVFFQFMKFAIIGGMNTMLDLGILNLLITITGISTGIFYSLFKSISFCFGVTSSYLWNKYWTFQDFNVPGLKEIIKFLFVNFIGFGINVGTASIVVNVIGAPAGITGELWANIGAVSAVIFSLFWNFIGMKFIVFKK